MPRQARLDTPGTLHHVIIRGIEKRRIVDDRKDRESFVTRMGDIASETKTAIYAWSLLTNHAHILLCSGPSGLPKFMRRLLTGYAITYNRRHNRYGHLFQNRYKSIVCEEDSYFIELVRYIHLNPLRAKLVKDLTALDRYPWSGHCAIVGKKRWDWQDCDYVLRWFGSSLKEAQTAYRRYVGQGIALGKRPELVGGGLIRSLGGWSKVLSTRRHGDRQLYDERILGNGDFVKQVLSQAEERMKFQLPDSEPLKMIRNIVDDFCKREKVNVREMRSGSRRRLVSNARSNIAHILVEDYGVPLSEIARHLGVSTSAISKIMKKKEK